MGNIIAFPTREQGFEHELPLAAGAEVAYPQPLFLHDQKEAQVFAFGGRIGLASTRHETLAPEATNGYEILPHSFGMNADGPEHLRMVREEARVKARQLLEHNRALNTSGERTRIHLDVDALGTIEKVEALKDTYGAMSMEYKEAHKSLVLDYARKWAEAFRKNKEEYFEPTVQVYDKATETLRANGLSVDDMLENGLSPLAEQEESDRRVNDYVLLQTHKDLVKHPKADAIGVVQLMPCPDWAIRSYQERPKGAHGGYAPEVEKLMIGFDWFVPDTQEVYHEQIAVPGTFYTMDVLNKVNQILDPETPTATDKTTVHGTHTLVDRQKISRAMDVLRVLDTIASEESGLDIFMGQVNTPGQPKDYEKLYQDAQRRRQEQRGLTRELVDYVETLYQKDIDHALATHMVEKFINDRLLKIAEADHEIASDAFNTETANGFRAAMVLREQGRLHEAEALLQETKMNAPPSSSCGAGSCGLESVDVASKEGEELKKALKADDGDEVVKDTERACKCGKKTIVYAYNENKVNKYCTSCKAFESKVTKNGQ